MRHLTIFLIFISLYNIPISNAQNREYESVGYIIETRGNYVFQPCKDSTSNILNNLSRGSFRLSFNPHIGILYPESFIPMMDEAKKLYCRLNDNPCDGDTGVIDSFPYYYCRIKISIPNYCKVTNNKCLSEIISNGVIYKFDGLSFVGDIIEFEPLRDIDRQNFIRYINERRNGYKTW